MFIKVKVISSSRSYQGHGYLRSRPLKVIQVQGESMSLKVKVISRSQSLRSRSFWNQMVMCFYFYPEASGWLSSECLLLLVYKSRLYDGFYSIRKIGHNETSAMARTFYLSKRLRKDLIIVCLALLMIPFSE